MTTPTPPAEPPEPDAFKADQSAPCIPLGCTRPGGLLPALCAPHVSVLRGVHLTGEPAADDHAPQVCVTICVAENCLHHVYNSPLWRLK